MDGETEFATPRLESLHGAGSPQAQRIQIARQMELEAKMAMARRVAGIREADQG